MTARGEVARGEQDRYAADGEGGQAVAQDFVGCVGQDEGKNAESDQRECVVSGICLHLRSIWKLSDPVLFFRKPVYRSAGMRALLCDRVSIEVSGTSMIGKSQGETEIPLDSAEWVPRARR
jgi:hypothetical protein